MSEEETKDETEVQDGDPKGGLKMDQLKRIGNQGKSDHVHKMQDGSFTSGAIEIESGGHLHTYETETRETKRSSISVDDSNGHTHETEKGPTGLPE